MRGFWTAVGALTGAMAKGWKGAVLGASLGYGLGFLLEERPEEREETESGGGPETRHPEEEIINAMRDAQNEPAAKGAEMADLYPDVVGSHPAGLAAAKGRPPKGKSPAAG